MPNLNVGLSLAMCCINTASAYLQVSAGSAVGTYCYDNQMYPGEPVVVACDCTLGFDLDGLEYCVDGETTCYLGVSGGVHYFCDLNGESACSFCNCNSNYSAWSSPNSSGVVTRIYEEVSNSNYLYCTSSKQTQYGCAAGYFKTSGSSSYSGTVYCTTCPAHNTTSGWVYGNTSTGNRSDATACWLPAGTASNFSDTKGSGTEKFTSTCYYSN